MSSRVVIERIATEEVLRSGATAEDLTFVEHFGATSRRCEVLAWRALVRRELGECQISHDEYGAPRVDIEGTYISVSHSRDYVALVVSDCSCAIDIESVERNFRGVASRYLSSAEQIIAEKHDLYAEMWCAKEALYKYYSKGNLDFVAHISIVDYSSEQGVLSATILDSAPIEVRISHHHNLAVAVIG
ncbi:MAG: 4'-phosphopantetheinyl transferase superfamily protein [Alistipes sp.]|nr:4'-phosphopantetheinyl transferase superfamily protein [Alistipes sp.]